MFIIVSPVDVYYEINDVKNVGVYSRLKQDYLNFINVPINHVLLLILVHVQLLSCLFFWLLASLRLKTTLLNIAQLFMKEMVKKYFGLLKIQVKFLINWSLEVF